MHATYLSPRDGGGFNKTAKYETAILWECTYPAAAAIQGDREEVRRKFVNPLKLITTAFPIEVAVRWRHVTKLKLTNFVHKLLFASHLGNAREALLNYPVIKVRAKNFGRNLDSCYNIGTYEVCSAADRRHGRETIIILWEMREVYVKKSFRMKSKCYIFLGK